MREIEFRGKPLYNPKNEWVYGGIAFGGEEFNHAVYITQPEIEGKDVQWLTRVDPATVGQYTGTRDCKRKEEYPKGQKIYEGDIVSINCIDYKGVTKVVFEDGAFRDRYEHWPIGSYRPHEIEVIGNNTDNPELLQ